MRSISSAGFPDHARRGFGLLLIEYFFWKDGCKRLNSLISRRFGGSAEYLLDCCKRQTGFFGHLEIGVPILFLFLSDFFKIHGGSSLKIFL